MNLQSQRKESTDFFTGDFTPVFLKHLPNDAIQNNEKSLEKIIFKMLGYVTIPGQNPGGLMLMKQGGPLLS